MTCMTTFPYIHFVWWIFGEHVKRHNILLWKACNVTLINCNQRIFYVRFNSFRFCFASCPHAIWPKKIIILSFTRLQYVYKKYHIFAPFKPASIQHKSIKDHNDCTETERARKIYEKKSVNISLFFRLLLLLSANKIRMYRNKNAHTHTHKICTTKAQLLFFPLEMLIFYLFIFCSFVFVSSSNCFTVLTFIVLVEYTEESEMR